MGKDLRTTCIYYLICPIDKKVKYVGRSARVKERYNEHLCDFSNSNKSKWTLSLLNNGLRPILELVEICAYLKGAEIEAKHIVMQIEKGNDLLNENMTHEFQSSNVVLELPYKYQSLLKNKAFVENISKRELLTLILEDYFSNPKNIVEIPEPVTTHFEFFKKDFESVNNSDYIPPKKILQFLYGKGIEFNKSV